MPDEAGKSAPKLVVLSWGAATVGAAGNRVPELAARIHAGKGGEGTGARRFRNAPVFVVAEEARKEDMRRKAVAHLVLNEPSGPNASATWPRTGRRGSANSRRNRDRSLRARSCDAAAMSSTRRATG